MKNWVYSTYNVWAFGEMSIEVQCIYMWRDGCCCWSRRRDLNLSAFASVKCLLRKNHHFFWKQRKRLSVKATADNVEAATMWKSVFVDNKIENTVYGGWLLRSQQDCGLSERFTYHGSNAVSPMSTSDVHKFCDSSLHSERE